VSTPHPNNRIHLTRWAVTAPAGRHRRSVHRPGLPGPRRTSPAGDANVSFLRGVQAGRCFVAKALILGVLATLASSCEDGPSDPSRSARVTGSVVLVQALSSMYDCSSTGMRTVEGPDSCQVSLIRGRALIASAYTTDGSYEFASVPPGTYQTAVGIWPCLSDTSQEFSVESDLAVPDTLRLGRVGSIGNCPNPFAARDGAKLYFGPGYDGVFTVDLTSLAGSLRHHIFRGSAASGIRYETVWGIIAGGDTSPLLGHHLIVLSIGPDSLSVTASALDVVTLQRPRNHDVP
jgi:hypothetical protein